MTDESESRRESEQSQHLLRFAADHSALNNNHACALAHASLHAEQHMHLALVDNERTPASPGLIGTCPACGSVMIPKCGNIKVHHWAHHGERHCDPWWERETEWHRAWKRNFPIQWQEVVQYDLPGERHIADVHTSHGLAVEFQHSSISSEERAAREKFYGNMLWVVDGSKRKLDFPRFLSQISSFRALTKTGLYLVPFPDETFPLSWADSSVPVVFDFGNSTAVSPSALNVTRSLWCLLPGRVLEKAVVWQLPRNPFVRSIHDMAAPIATAELMKHVEALLLREQQAHGSRLRLAWGQRGSGRRYARF